MKLIKYIAIFLFCFGTINCKHEKEPFNKTGLSKIFNKYPALKGKPLTIAYFDGDCALCIAKISQIERKLNGEEKAIFIAQTANPEILRWTMNKSKIISPLIVDSNFEFKTILILNQIVYLDTEGSIVNTAKFSD